MGGLRSRYWVKIRSKCGAHFSNRFWYQELQAAAKLLLAVFRYP